MPDFLEQKRSEISKRLSELKPLVDEYARLEQADAALAGVGGGSDTSGVKAPTGTRRRGGRLHGASKATATEVDGTKRRATSKRRAGRPKGTGGRAAEALAAVKGQPGITIPELATKMGIKQNYLYRVLPGLQKEKKVRKKDKGWHPA